MLLNFQQQRQPKRSLRCFVLVKLDPDIFVEHCSQLNVIVLIFQAKNVVDFAHFVLCADSYFESKFEKSFY